MKKIYLIIVLFLILLLSLYLAIYAGHKDFGVNMLCKAFHISEDADSVILSLLRYPRAVKAFVAGVCLALSGMFMQSITQNPLVEPYITGISSGAGLGIVLSVLLFNSSSYSLFGFFGALCSAVIVIVLAGMNKFSITKLVLVGLSMNIFVSSLISLIILLNPTRAYSMMLILSGGVTNSEIITNNFLVSIFLVLIFVSALFVSKLNYLRLDSSLLEIDKTKKYFYSIAAIMIGAFLASVSVFAVGILGFIGIIAPQISRMIFGLDYRWLFLSNILLGGSLVLFSDYLARTVVYPLQVPLGLVVSFIGAPVFVYFLIKNQRGFND